MSNPLVSIIVPTYNVEKYLEKCLDSINNQTFQDYEVIVIIDGSTDKSFEIAKDYCTCHSKFSVFWQDNAGSGPARNNGLQKASGDFVMFVDPDDWLEPELLQTLIVSQSEKDFDLVVTKRIFVTCNDLGNVISVKKDGYSPESLEGKQIVRTNYLRLLKSEMVDSPTQKLYKMSIIRENSIEFPSLRRSQDIVFNYRYYDHISSIYISNYSGYNYRRELRDIAGKMDIKYYQIIEYLYKDIKQLYINWDIDYDLCELSNFFFEIRLMSYYQRCADNHWSILESVNNPAIHEIIHNSNPKSFHNKIIRFLLVKRFYSLASFVIYMVIKTKRFIKSL